MNEPHGSFDPQAFAEKWYEENTEVLDKFIKNQTKMGVDPTKGEELEEELEETPRDLFELFVRDEESFDRDLEAVHKLIREHGEETR